MIPLRFRSNSQKTNISTSRKKGISLSKDLKHDSQRTDAPVRCINLTSKRKNSTSKEERSIKCIVKGKNDSEINLVDNEKYMRTVDPVAKKLCFEEKESNDIALIRLK